jgi:hypothetical protein
MKKNLNIGIIGGGIFGITAAIYLSKLAKNIVIFEKKKDILLGATKFNHNRHHYGYHYPRSQETAEQCLKAKKVFNKFYQKALDFNFKNYYAIAKKNSRINFDHFNDFCFRNKISAKNVDVPEKIFNSQEISKCYLVDEGIYNYEILSNILKKRLKEITNIKILKEAKISTHIDKSKKIKLKKNNQKKETYNFDLIVNATYENINEFILHDKNKIKLEYNLQEMCKIDIPGPRFGATILDGFFPSILPNSGEKSKYLFAHVKYSQLIKLQSFSIPRSLRRIKNIQSNRKEIFDNSKKYLKILSNAVYDNSFFVIRAVNVDNLTDKRTSEIIKYDNGNLTIFSGKIICAEEIGTKLYENIKKEY